MKCTQCSRPALYHFKGDDGKSAFYLCVDCNLKHEQAQTLEFDRQARHYNRLAAQAEQTFGIPGYRVARIPDRQRDIIQAGDITLNNIRVDNSTIGVLNTGRIETVDHAITFLKNEGSNDVADALEKLTEAIAANTEASEEQKNQILDMLSLVATEATAPPEKRHSSAIKPVLRQLATMCSGLKGLAQIWQQYAPIIQSVFQ